MRFCSPILIITFAFASAGYAASSGLLDLDDPPPIIKERNSQPVPPAQPAFEQATPATATPEEAKTEANTKETCGTCDPPSRITDLKKVVDETLDIKSLKGWKRNTDSDRTLVQIPTMGSLGTAGPCHSIHYNPNIKKGQVVDNYATPITACSMMSLLQDWRKTQCKDETKGCNVQWGDISHRDRAHFPPHFSHGNGECIDFRPMRKGDADISPLTFRSKLYDRKAMRAFTKMAIAKGADPVIFNDPKIDVYGLGRSEDHDNHVHLCFKDSDQTRKTCANYKYDRNICGELK